MNPRKVVGAIAALLSVAGLVFWWFTRAPEPVQDSSRGPVVGASKPRITGATTSVRPQVPANDQTPVPSAASADWRNAFDHGAGVLEAFAAAVQAAEGGDPRAVLVVRSYVAQCAPYFGSPYQPWMDKPEFLPPGGLEELTIDERCSLIARAPEFADRSRQDRLSPAYWERVAERVDEPLAASFRVSAGLVKLNAARPEERAALQAAVTADIRHVLRSGDATAWFDLGSHGAAQGAGGDPSYGLALALAACDLGYEWKALGKEGSGQSLEQRAKDALSPDIYARTQARYSELQALIRAGNWAEIETFLPLDGPLFK